VPKLIHRSTSNIEDFKFEYKRSHVLDNLNINPFIQKQSNKITNDKLSYLQTISSLPSLNQIIENDPKRKKVKFANSALSTDHKNEMMEINPMKVEVRKDEEIILIDNQAYGKNQFDVISKLVLKKCNFTHEKNKNNTKSLKKGEGKLMITSGMTVHDFQEKYPYEKNH